MRDIRFRAWDKMKRKMSPPFGFADLYGYEGECNAVNVEVGETHFMLTAHNSGARDGAIQFAYPQIKTTNGVDPDITLLQYTGLKDQNGKEIYEGDIVNFGRKHLNTIAQVVWASGGACFVAASSDPILNLSNTGAMCAGKCEVIANVYENLELLKEKA